MLSMYVCNSMTESTLAYTDNADFTYLILLDTSEEEYSILTPE